MALDKPTIRPSGTSRMTASCWPSTKLAILSNGSTDMLTILMSNSGSRSCFRRHHHSKRIFKPSPEACTLIESSLGIFAGHRAVRIVESVRRLRCQGLWPDGGVERVVTDDLALACAKNDLVPPLTMFKAIRMQMDEFGLEHDWIKALADLPELLKSLI